MSICATLWQRVGDVLLCLGPDDTIGGVPMSEEELSVLTLEGEAVPLSSLWAKGPGVLVFLRHYG